ncbi:hypothetical protein SteCoe_21076 [Stentor coeruleus]|uniref:Ribophorin II C-terminal domain-containing protein n=1 Tax=Stentor coeruleus TaxID=5963 RepID=A0A1R2BQH8_9CILI|nr:hypothetical protein SteCoe_21076 [Stentor coeruleus]
MFSPPADRPNQTIALVFTSLVLIAFSWFVLELSRLGLNLELWSKINKTASLLFISSISTVIGILIWFWVQGNIIITVEALGLFSVIFIYSVKVFFKAHANTKS